MAVKSMFNRLKFWKRTINPENFHFSECSSEHRLAYTLKRYEKFVSELQSIVMWDNPAVSTTFIVLVNILFWMLVSMEWRFFGIVTTMLLAGMIYDAWTGHIWPEISVPASDSEPSPDVPTHPSVLAVSKMLTATSAAISHYLAWLRNLRMQQPGVFCSLLSLIFSSLLLLGRTVSGILIVYTLTMSILLGPGLVLRYMPPQVKQSIAQYASCVHQAFDKFSNDVSDDEYLPITNSEDIALLTRASDLHHDTYDSLTHPGSSSDMASGLGLMPSHEEDSIGTLSDLEPCASQLPFDPADDSDSNPGDHQIQFQSGHFNGDSSSSDEEPFAKDLTFPETEEKEKDSAAARGLTSFISQAMSTNVLGSMGVLASALRIRTPYKSDESNRQRTIRRADQDSDFEDFELINRDELNGQDFS